MITKAFIAAIWHEDSWFIAQCLEPDVASQGDTREQALENLLEALRLHFAEPSASRETRDLPGSTSSGVPEVIGVAEVPGVPAECERVQIEL